MSEDELVSQAAPIVQTPTSVPDEAKIEQEEAQNAAASPFDQQSQPSPHIPLTHYVDLDSLDPASFLEEVLKSRRELHIARQQFEQVSDPLLIDHIVFRIGAAERHLNYLFRLAREHQIAFEGRQWEWTSDTWRLE